VADLVTEGTVSQVGVAPRRIDIIPAASELDFEDTYARSWSVDLDGIETHIPLVEDMIRNKRATGRTKDLADAEALEQMKNRGSFSPFS
jgi:hypothetical protein